VLRQHTDADGPSRQPLQHGVPIDEPQDPRCADRLITGQDPAEHSRLDLSLYELRDHGGQQPAPPHLGHALRRHGAVAQGTCEEASRPGSVLHRQVDAK
jgi:hypothetical protein